MQYIHNTWRVCFNVIESPVQFKENHMFNWYTKYDETT